ncbi:MAG TPA: transketolase [Candidatus Limnocylindria bacterium]|jgi:transketolase|nr:transketolase [Candidatus Limnocylindria bacterium]
MTTIQQRTADRLYDEAVGSFEDWDAIREIIDEAIDLALNYRQSGHPGGSRSKVHMFLALLLSGAMRWDVRKPWRPFADRFVLSAGHTIPLVYATLAVLNEVLRARAERDPDPAFTFPDDGRWALTWEDLLKLRRRGGLPGHAEMEGKTLFIKFNTGPSGHGQPPSAGEAVALKLAGAEEVKVFVVEGEGGLTPGASHETRNSAWGLGLNNLVYLLDWNDYGIDDPAISSVVPGTPQSWFEAYDWRVTGTMEGSEWGPVTRAVLEAARGENPDRVPSVAWFKTRKGRGYGKYDNKSHGTPHAMNSPEFWAVRREFMARHGVEYAGVDEPAPKDAAEQQAQARHNFGVAMGVLRDNTTLVDAISDRLVEVAGLVPDHVEGFNLGGRGAEIFSDGRITDAHAYPPEMWKPAGEKAANRSALATWGSWVNAYAKQEFGRPLFIVCSADLAESTNIAGFAKDFGEMPGWGWYQRDTNPRGALLPQQITEFTNSGVTVGIATVNLADDPMSSFNGFWAACSTYGSFSYLKYGPMRLFSQLAQDCELKVGRVIWVAGHSGPETAEDSRTHFGIYETGVTQLFPEGHVIDLHPWEYNEVPVVLAAALATDVPIVALHLTRPTVDIPDRAALGMASHFEAARGAYLIRDVASGTPSAGTVYVQGTVTTANVVKTLPQLDQRGLNVRIVACISPQLFRRQDAAYQASIRSDSDKWSGMAITNRAFKLMTDFVEGPVAKEYSLSSDFDNRWRTGGTVDEVMDEAHLGPGHILDAIERYAADREARHARLREIIAGIGED